MKKTNVIFILFFFLVAFTVRGQNKINYYEYWFDDNYAAKVGMNITPVPSFTLNTSIGTSSLNDGLHMLHIRFRDDSSNYSTTVSNYFLKTFEGGTSANNIVAYEYWFDNDYAARVYQTITPVNELNLSTQIDVASLINGFHVFHIRFKDSGNSWGFVNSSFFKKNALLETTDNLISGYRYWFDLADATIYNVSLPVPIKTYQLDDQINLLIIPKGPHDMHIQFRDTLGNWSTVITDSIYRNPVVKAEFTPDNLLICDSGLINFTNTSIDADTFRWDFGDGIISQIASPVHFFDSPGTYPVKLTAYDTLNGVKDSVTINISVVASPIVNLGSDTTICPSFLLLDARNPGCTYEWSDSSADSILNISDPGIYSVVVTDQWNCQSADTIQVLFYEVPVVDLGVDTTICPSTLTLNAWNPDCSYAWSNFSTDSIIQISDSGTYSVMVTSQSGCLDQDTIQIHFYQVPVVDLGADTIICPSEIMLDAWNPACTYEWSNLSNDSVIYVSDSGQYFVTVTNQWICSTYGSINIYFHPTPAIELGNDTTICIGDSVILDAGTGFTAYAWSTGETTQTIVVKTADTYTVEVTNTDGCSKTDSVTVLIDPCAGMEEWNNNLISVYPNPNNGLYFIQTLSDFTGPVDIMICDLSGRTIYKTRLPIIRSYEIIEIDNSNFENGVYLLLLTSNHHRITEKIIVSH